MKLTPTPERTLPSEQVSRRVPQGQSVAGVFCALRLSEVDDDDDDEDEDVCRPDDSRNNALAQLVLV